MGINVITQNGLIGLTRNTLQQVNNVFKSCLSDDVAKVDTQGITTQTNLTYYDLQPGAKLLYPVLTPFRNELPRVQGDGGTATNWKAVLGVNVGRTSIGVSEGNRSAVMVTREKDYTAKYATIGLENFVSFEGDHAAGNFEDVKALASRNLLQAMMIGEESVIFGGNSSLQLGTTPTPTLATATTGGSLPASTAYSVICVALSYEGYSGANVSNGIAANVVRTNADGSQDTYGGGAAQKSASATITTGAGATNSITASVAPVQGAFGYAWFWGAAGSEKLGAITTINSVSITNAAAGTQTAASLPAADWSTNSMLFDGYLTQICNPTSGAYFYSMPTGTPGAGTGLTAGGAGNIKEIDAALQSFWDNYRVSPDEIVVSSQELNNITNKVIAGGGAPLFRFNVDAQKGDGADVTVTAGAIVGFYLNRFALNGGILIPVRLHPNCPPGTIMFRKKSIPYAMSNVVNIAEIRYLRDYYQIPWPLRTRKYEFGVYAREVMPIYFPPAFGVITNIGNS